LSASKTVALFVVFPNLSRACLGKTIIFISQVVEKKNWWSGTNLMTAGTEADPTL
jgi:hypothetical protein